MTVDWNVVATISSPIIALFVGAALERFIEDRAKVVCYLGHVSGIQLNRENQIIHINTHSIVLTNTGRKTATNIRLGHAVLPDFQVFPDTQYNVIELPNGGREIQFPNLVPKKQITITYLYFPPLTWNQVNTHLESDDGPVKVLNVLPTVQLPKWLITLLWLLIGYGLIAALYTVYAISRWLVR